MNDRRTIQTDAAGPAVGPYSQAVRAGPLLFTAGQIPLRPDGSLVDGGIEEQTRQVLANLREVLRAGGSDPSRVVKCTIFLQDMDDFAVVNGIYGETFDHDPPARSAVQVARLPKDVTIEIEAIALCD
ncbi:MAG: RidA family protein [Trueperaceae bacterium]